MKAVILAGGLGTRISEETHLKPKPMIEIGGMPILWHIMKSYSHHGVKDFIILAGYKASQINNFFSNYLFDYSDIEVNFSNNSIEILNSRDEGWVVRVINTGLNTQTGGRLKRVADYLEENENFCFTYGDVVSDVNITDVINFHRKHGKLASVTAYKQPTRYGILKKDGEQVFGFNEKPETSNDWINAGFFVLSKKVLNYIEGDQTIFEQEPMKNIAKDNQLRAYEHDGFLKPMDTLKEKMELNDLWDAGKAPWKNW
jgi:glucose-1-phosphate cytidylyltransferase